LKAHETNPIMIFILY